ncbi:serine hydrolase domain-containing protein [Paucibacter soli]|uniref:serine hydrolase domain-containing protein n=1 Tax=Paucibacter soli TaxID=3133433 RepID=UPI0030A9A8AB
MSNLQTRIDGHLATLTRPQSPGHAVAVARHGELLYASGHGLASLEQRSGIGADTLFRIASVSKQFTVAAGLRLAAQGRLDLAADARGLLAELAQLPQAVTVDQLMRNCSGLPDFLELLRLGGVGLEQLTRRASMAAALARNRHLNSKPGSRFLYCNSNYLLLGLLVERLSGQSLGDYLQQAFFAPLGMTQTRMVPACDQVLPGLAAPYLRQEDDGGYRRALHGFEHGGEGGLVSNVLDLTRWAQALLAPRSELAALAEALMAPTLLSGAQPSPYARGLEHSRWRGHACVGHGGLWPGYRSEFLLLPAEGLSIVVISNDSGSNPYKLARELLDLLLPPTAMAEPTAPPAPDWAGDWINAEAGLLLGLQRGPGTRLTARQWGQCFELYPEADGSWLPLRGAYEFRLRAGPAGTLLLETGAGRQHELQRLARREPLPAGLAGRWHCADIASHWDITAEGEVSVHGPLMRSPQPWQLLGLTDTLMELRAPGYWMSSSQLLRVAERGADGRIIGLSLDSSRIRGLRFSPLP